MSLRQLSDGDGIAQPLGGSRAHHASGPTPPSLACWQRLGSGSALALWAAMSLKGKLGQGGMGAAYHVHDKRKDRAPL